MTDVAQPTSLWRHPLDDNLGFGWAGLRAERVRADLCPKGYTGNFAKHIKALPSTSHSFFNSDKYYWKIRITGLSALWGNKITIQNNGTNASSNISFTRKLRATVQIVAFNAFQWLLEFFKSPVLTSDHPALKSLEECRNLLNT